MEISKVDSTILAKQLGMWRILRIIFFILCIAYIALFVSDLPALYVVPIGLIVTAFFMWLFSRPIRQLNRELSSREQSQEETLSNKKLEKKAAKTLLVFMIIVCILGGIFAVKLWGGITSGYDSKEKCRNCGRTTDIVPGFGYCEDCYGGFVDWQKDNWK